MNVNTLLCGSSEVILDLISRRRTLHRLFTFVVRPLCINSIDSPVTHVGFFTSSNVERVLEQIPSGLFVLTAAHEGSRFGILANWVQPCSKEPPMAMAAVERGNAIAPLIRDSRRF